MSVGLPAAALAKESSSHALRFRIVARTPHYVVAKGVHSSKFRVRDDQRKVTLHGKGRFRVVRVTRKFVSLRAYHRRTGITVTAPSSSATYQRGAKVTVNWTSSIAYSAGEFGIWVQSATGTRYDLMQQPTGGQTSLSVQFTLDAPVAKGYHAMVGYRANVGSGTWTSVAQSAGTLTVIASTPAPAPTVTPSASPAPIEAPAPAPTTSPIPIPIPTPTIPPSTGTLNLNPPDGYVFNGGGTYTTSGTLTLNNNCTVMGVKFTNSSRGVVIEGNGNTVQGCTFGANNWAALMVTCGSHNVLDHNTFNTTKGQGGNIQVCGGSYNQITGNVTKGGITGIIFLYRRSVNGGGAKSLCTGNVISGNTCSGMSEEGISLDVFGNGSADGATIEYDKVKAVSGNTVTLSSLSFANLVGYDLCPISGALNGRTRNIVAQSGNVITLDSAPTGLAVGDEVVIGATFKGNVIAGNTVSGGWMTINLYGMCYGNLVENNHATDIKVESTDNLDVAGISATKAYGRAPCGYNTVKNNVCSGTVQLQYYAWPTSPSGHANAYSPYQSVGNSAIGNSCTQVQANEQNCYITGNSGGNRLSDVTLSPVPMQ